MTESDLESIELRLGIALPGRYRTALRSVADAAGVSLEPYFDREARSLLNSNLELRLSGREFDGKPWPSNCFQIGHDGCGNFYFLEVDDPTCAVQSYDHETDEVEMYAGSLEAFLRKIAKLVGGTG
jgi:hypothetical protein